MSLEDQLGKINANLEGLNVTFGKLNTNLERLIAKIPTLPFLKEGPPETPAVKNEPQEKPAKTPAKPKGADSAAAAKPKAEPAPASDPDAEGDDNPEKVTQKSLGVLVTELGSLVGRDATIALISKFGGDRLPKVPADRYVDLEIALSKAINKAKEAK
jgi:hypothetical protein